MRSSSGESRASSRRAIAGRAKGSWAPNELLAPNQPAAQSVADRFDWSAAAGGAGATLAFVLCVLGSVVLVRRGRRAVTDAG